MVGNDYDNIAQILREALRRYPDDGLRNTLRLKGLLTDHLVGLDSEINIVLSAIEDDVAEQFQVTGSAEADISVGRLSQRFEDARGLRSDIAKSAVLAIGYALGLTGLPSSEVAEISKSVSNAPELTDDAIADKRDEWVGLSEPVEESTHHSNTTAKSDHAGKNGTSKLQTWMKLNPIRSLAVIGGAVALAFFVFGGQQEQQPQQPQPQQPQPQQPQPQQPQPQQPQQPQRSTEFVVDDAGYVWRPSARDGNPSKGIKGLRSTNKGETLIMRSKVRQDGTGFNFQIFRGSAVVARGIARVQDQTHASYQLYDENSQPTGQGRFHYNHFPR